MPTALPYPPAAGDVLQFIKGQVTAALNNPGLFPEEEPEITSSILCALGLLCCVPPVPANRRLLEEAFAHMQLNFKQMLTTPFAYKDVVHFYNQFLGIFEVSAALPPGAPLGNPYYEIARAAALPLGFAEDSSRIFYLAVWASHCCKDALSTFYIASNTGTAQRQPAPSQVYYFVAHHVNNTLADPYFFAEGTPINITEVLTALYTFVAALPAQSNTLVQQTLQYTQKKLLHHRFSPGFFDTIVYATERIAATYNANLVQGQQISNYTLQQCTNQALKIMGHPANTTSALHITSYLPTLLADAMQRLYS
ncbi:hypothetical protein LJC61_06270 [Ruminococcaceae bacterium OttesenSCG-928-A16]|nr:hypothetical protein [Ruminococcaceae bacterium OttesenSCG-928-A16]